MATAQKPMASTAIIPIEAEKTWALRHQVLRPNQTLADCAYPTDNDPGAFHLGAFQNDVLVAIASFYREQHPDLEHASQYRLRGMAVQPELQTRGLGRLLIDAGEQELRSSNVNAWWCNARSSAAGYYAKMGLQQLGPEFDLPPLGPHKVMYRVL